MTKQNTRLPLETVGYAEYQLKEEVENELMMFFTRVVFEG
jgi:hypothetical protein